MKTLSSELNDRISREINGLIGTVNVQIQTTVEEAICSQVLPQVQNVLREVHNRDAFGPRDQERPESRPDCLDREKQGQTHKNNSNMSLNARENQPDAHYRSVS